MIQSDRLAFDKITARFDAEAMGWVDLGFSEVEQQDPLVDVPHSVIEEVAIRLDAISPETKARFEAAHREVELTVGAYTAINARREEERSEDFLAYALSTSHGGSI